MQHEDMCHPKTCIALPKQRVLAEDLLEFSELRKSIAGCCSLKHLPQRVQSTSSSGCLSARLSRGFGRVRFITFSGCPEPCPNISKEACHLAPPRQVPKHFARSFGGRGRDEKWPRCLGQRSAREASDKDIKKPARAPHPCAIRVLMARAPSRTFRQNAECRLSSAHGMACSMTRLLARGSPFASRCAQWGCLATLPRKVCERRAAARAIVLPPWPVAIGRNLCWPRLRCELGPG